MKRLIDADMLIDAVEYQCESNGSMEALKWCAWFKEVINAEYNREQRYTVSLPPVSLTDDDKFKEKMAQCQKELYLKVISDFIEENKKDKE